MKFETELNERILAHLDSNRERLSRFESELLRFNKTHNLVSRASEQAAYEQHIVHSVALACFGFPPGARLVDWGSGGGLPAIPLAILFPSVHVTAVDRIAKKTNSIEAIARRCELKNLDVNHVDAGSYSGEPPSYSVSRATAPLSVLWGWHQRVADSRGPTPFLDEAPEATGPGMWEKGLICLKGGDLSAEISELVESDPDVAVSELSLARVLKSDYFAEKAIVHLRHQSRSSVLDRLGD